MNNVERLALIKSAFNTKQKSFLRGFGQTPTYGRDAKYYFIRYEQKFNLII